MYYKHSLILASLLTAVSCLQVDLDSLDLDLNSNSRVAAVSQYAIATLVSSEDYVHGAIALAGSFALQPTDGISLVAVAVMDDGSGMTGISQTSADWLRLSGWEVKKVNARDAIRCVTVDAKGLERFQNGCAKFHLWSELDGVAGRVIYIDADSMARPVFNIQNMFVKFADSLFAAKPVPPDTQDCGGTQAQIQLSQVSDKLTLSFTETSIGIAVVDDGAGSLEIAGVREPAASMGVKKGYKLTHINGEQLDGVSPTLISQIFQSVPRPITLSFQKSGQGSNVHSGAVPLTSSSLHACHDLFNSNIFIFTPSKQTFAEMTQAFENLKRSEPNNVAALAFDSGFLSRFFGKYWESDSKHWLSFRNHMEMTLSPKHWPFHPMVAANTEEAAQSPALANLLAWSEIQTLDFSGSAKPWHILEAVQHMAATSQRTDDILTVAHEVIDRVVPGGGVESSGFDQQGGQVVRRPFVDLYVALWVQWMGAYHRGCMKVMQSSEAQGLNQQGSLPFCQLLPDLASSFLV